MIPTELEVLDLYANAFRNLVNSRVWPVDETPEKLLRLSDADDWSFICVAMDVIGDASLAVGNFLRFSLDGPTRYDEDGERYLRLYGVLSATYLQQEAIAKLYKLMNCRDPKKIRDRFATLSVRVLRNKVASHSVDFRPIGGGSIKAYVPIRLGLKGYSCDVTENRGERTEHVDLREALREHHLALIEVMDTIFAKSRATLFKGHQKRLKELAVTLADLRFQRDGNIIVRGGNGEGAVEMRISFGASASDNGGGLDPR